MEVVADWESMNVVFQEGPLVLSRVVSDALASFSGTAIGEDDDKTSILDENEFQVPVEDDLDAVLEALGETSDCYTLTATPGAASLKSEMDETESDFDDEDHPAILSYSSSDDTSSEKNSSSSSSECGSTTKALSSSAKKRQSATQQQQTGVQKKRTRASAGLSAQEKRELRKLRNRELAAESRKRKNEEMDRLRQENSELKLKIAELEKKLQQQQVVPNGKRTRIGTKLSASVAAVSLAAFVVMDPSEHYQTASVLLTALDSCDGHLLPSSISSNSSSSWSMFGFWIVSSLILSMMFAMLARMAIPLIVKSVATFVRTPASSSASSLSTSKALLPRRVTSLTTIAHSVV